MSVNLANVSKLSLQSYESLFEKVKQVIKGLGVSGHETFEIAPRSRLVEDLGLDSLKFVDLTVGLEDALGIQEFPMQEWVDSEIEAERPLTVEALVMACRACLQNGQNGQSDDQP